MRALSSLALALLLAAPVHAAGLAVTGQVQDSQGKPVPGARLELIPQTGSYAAGKLAAEGRATPDPVAQAASDAQGRFVLTAPEPGMWRVVVRSPGTVPRAYPLTPLVEPADLPVVKLEPDAGIKVRVVDREGRPLAGARVSIRPDPSWRETWSVAPRLGVTGGDGTVVLPRGKGEELRLSAVAPGLPAVSLDKVSAASAELRLAAGCERTVEVTDRGRAAAGVLVRAGGWVQGTTDAEGKAVVAAGCEEETRLTLLVEDGRQAFETLRPPPKGAAARPARFALPSPASLTGRVLEQGTRRPVAGALVWTEGAPIAFVRTDARGAYTVPAPPADETRFQAAAVGYLESSEELRSPTAGPTFLLQPAAWVRGTVVDAAGGPVAGAGLQVFPEGRNRPGRWLSNPSPSRSSDSRGLFRLRLTPGQRWELTVSHPELETARVSLEPLAPREERSGVRVVLSRGRTAFGVVLDTAEQPVAGAEVWLWPAPEQLDPYAFRFGSGRHDEHRAVADARGRFRFEHLPAGRFDLEATARGFAGAVVPGVEVQETGETDLGTLLLEPGVSIEGSVVDPRGRPLEGARIYSGTESSLFRRPRRILLEQGQPAPQAVTGADGRFILSDLRSGDRLRVRASKEGYRQTEEGAVSEVPAEQPVRIVLTPLLRLTGRVVDDKGAAVAGALVHLSRARTGLPLFHRSDTGQSGEDGRFTLEVAEPGRFSLGATAPGYLPGELEVEVPPAGTVEGLELVLRPGAVILGRVLGPDGTPVAGANLQLIDSSGAQEAVVYFQGSALTDGDGHYRLDGVPEGSHSVAATHSEYQRAVRDVEVRAGENRLDLRLERGFGISGRVLDGLGGPVEGATVMLDPWGEEPRDAVSAAGGAFSFPSVPSGTHRIRAEKEGLVPASEEVQTAGAPVTGVELRLVSGSTIRGRVLGLDMAELATVSLMATSGEAGGRQGRVDYQGTYRIGGLGAGTWTVIASTSTGWTARGKATVSGTGDETMLDLEFKRGLTLTGRVLRAGQPVPSVSVSAKEEGKETSGFGTTDAQGGFRVQGLQPGSYTLTLMQFGSGGLVRHQEKVELEGDRDITIELPSLRVTGRVVDAADTSPLSGATVRLEPVAGQEPGSMSWREGAVSDSGGAFVVEGVKEGGYRVVAQKRGYAPGEATIEVTASGAPEVALALSATEGLALEVVTPAGVPPAYVSTALVDPASGRVVVREENTPGENGRVRLTSAPPGRWRLLAASPETATTAVDVTVPGPVLRIVLSPPGRLAVSVPDLAADRQRGTLILIGADGQKFHTIYGLAEWPVVEGRSEVESLPPGTWQVVVTAADGRSWQGTAATVAGGRVEVRLE